MRCPSRAAALWALLIGPLGLSAGLPSCADFTPLASHACGNAVIDAADEDCDTYGTEPGTKCGAANTTNPCRFVCGGSAKATCPGGWGCGQDGICRQPSGRFAPVGDIVPFASPHSLRRRGP
jgi:hypothetical protein